jgi:hypothetical protein
MSYEDGSTLVLATVVVNSIVVLLLEWCSRPKVTTPQVTITITDARGHSVRTQAQSTRHAEDIREEVDQRLGNVG